MTHSAAPPVRIRWPIYALLIGALLLRLTGLSAKSLWIDEAKAIADNRRSVATILDTCRSTHTAPLRELTIHALTQGPRRGWEFTTRLPSALAGALAVVLIFAVGRRAMGWPTGLAAAVFVLAHPWHLHHSQDGRMHGVVMALAALALWFAYRLIFETPRWRDGLWLGLTLAVSLYFSYLTSMFILALAGATAVRIAVLAARRSSRRAAWRTLGVGVWTAVVALGLFAPWMGPALRVALGYVAPSAAAPTQPNDARPADRQPIEIDTPAASWRPPYATDWNRAYFRGLALDFGGGRSRVAPWAAGLAAVLALVGLIDLAARRRRLLLVPACWFLAPAPILLVSNAGWFFPTRYLIYGLVVYALLVGRGAVALGEAVAHFGRDGARRVGAGLTMLALGAVVAAHVAALPRYYTSENQNWRDAMAWLEREMHDGDKLIAGDHWTSWPLRAYATPHLNKRLNLVVGAVRYDRFRKQLTESPRTWYVQWAVMPKAYRATLAQHMECVRTLPGTKGDVRIWRRRDYPTKEGGDPYPVNN